MLVVLLIAFLASISVFATIISNSHASTNSSVVVETNKTAIIKPTFVLCCGSSSYGFWIANVAGWTSIGIQILSGTSPDIQHYIFFLDGQNFGGAYPIGCSQCVAVASVPANYNAVVNLAVMATFVGIQGSSHNNVTIYATT
jgi:hypothetical protein